MPEKNIQTPQTPPKGLTPEEQKEERREAKRIQKTLKKIHRFLNGYKKRRKKVGKYKKKFGLIRIGKLPKIKKFGKGKAWKRKK